MMFRSSLLTAVVVLSSIPAGHAQQVVRSSKTLEDSASALNLIEYRYPCYSDAPCAGAKYPAYYNFVSTTAVYSSLGNVLQTLGFGINPDESKPKNLEILAKGKRYFWTDFIPLDDAALRKFGTSRSALRLSENPKIFYEIQITIICSAKNPLQDDFDKSPSVAERTLDASDSPFFTRTQADLAFTLIVKKRGEKGSFVDDDSDYNGLPILDWVNVKVKDAISSTKPDERVNARFGHNT